MTQLWLRGQRMDSIPLLRAFLAACTDEEELDGLLLELVRKYQSGSLSRWMERRREAQPPSALQLALDGQASQLGQLLRPRRPLGEVLPALAELCTGEESLRAGCLSRLEALVAHEADRQQTEDRKRSKVECQPWYSGMRKLFEHIDWDAVVTDTEELTMLLHRLSEEHHSGQATVYLCHTGSRFQIRHPLQLRRVRLVGCGSPSVSIASQYRGHTLDLAAQELVLESLRLYTQGMELTNTEHRIRDVEVG